MTADVATVEPDAPVTFAARIMRDASVSELPVVDCDGCLVGIVTEADLLRRAVVPDSADAEAKRSARDRWPGSTIADLMGGDVTGVRWDDPLAKAARFMEKARVRRPVVVRNAFALEGIISRSDVVPALTRSDTDIRAEVVGHMVGIDPDTIDVWVHQGVVTLRGSVAHRQEAVGLERLANSVIGVSRVDSSVTWQIDTSFAGRVPRFGSTTERRHATRGGHDDTTKDNEGAV